MHGTSPLEVAFATTILAEVGGLPDGGFNERDAASDPGGATKYGISIRAHRDDIGDRDGDGDIDADDVRLLTIDDARNLFERDYWLPCRCPAMPPALAVLVADCAYNSGARRAVTLLQQSCNAIRTQGGKAYFSPPLAEDGVVGPATITAAGRTPLTALLLEYQAQRMLFMASLANWSANRKGWTRRVMRLLAVSLTLGGRDGLA